MLSTTLSFRDTFIREPLEATAGTGLRTTRDYRCKAGGYSRRSKAKLMDLQPRLRQTTLRLNRSNAPPQEIAEEVLPVERGKRRGTRRMCIDMVKLFTGGELAATTGTKIFNATANGGKTPKSPSRRHLTLAGKTSPLLPARAKKQYRLIFKETLNPCDTPIRDKLSSERTTKPNWRGRFGRLKDVKPNK
jgi:hypothetical protein